MKATGSAATLLAVPGCLKTPAAGAAGGAGNPNIIYILADDLGYGDLSCLNRNSAIKTPHLDRLASQGVIFTDAHSGSAVCTPTRYGVLTGRYCWRTHLRSGVLWGFSPPLIAPSRLTVASLLKQHGYHTACLGKWHLGLDWPRETGVKAAAPKKRRTEEFDFTRPIANGPNTVGFDYYFGISASLDMPPYCWIENDRTVGIPSATKDLWPKGSRSGPAHPDFAAEDVLPTLARKAVEYIGERKREGRPFFLYMPLNSPHTPIAPSQEFRGRSGVGPYGDFVMETDWAVGQVMEALDRNALAGNTLLIFASDNGCSPEADFSHLARYGHNPNYVFRGHKADIWEGGHRIPFVARWPGKARAGSACDDTICLTDLMATCAAIVGTRLPDDAGEDSVSILENLLGTAGKPAREATVHQSINGSLAIRKGKWKLEMCPGSGGWSQPGDEAALAQGLPAVQLHDLTRDIGEQMNLQAEHPEIVAELKGILQGYIDRGRSTPGAPQKNDVAVPIAIARRKGDGGT